MPAIQRLVRRFRPLKTNIQGCLDGVINGAVSGWAYDPDRPAAFLSVELSIDGKLFETVVANQYRLDLENAGIGKGFHGFRVPVPRAALDANLHELSASVAGSGATLQNSPVSMRFDAPPSIPDATEEPEPWEAISKEPQTGADSYHRQEGREHSRQSAVPKPAPPPTSRVTADAALAALSVVIPTYNRGAMMERNLRTCLGAAAGLNVEFILIDDGSADDTPERLRAMAAEFPNLRWKSIPNGGPGQARNLGVSMAANELILFLGDDIEPASQDFYQHHMNAHRMVPATRVGVLGKVIWPNSATERVSFLMAHIQGAGQQQFGFYSLLPYTWLDWRFFYTSNVSCKKSVISDWLKEGFSTEFRHAAFEDGEFAYRVDRKVPGGFQILYCPAATATHYHPYTVRQFIERQVTAGISGKTFTRVHPEAAKKLGADKVDALLASPVRAGQGLVEDLIRMIEGVKSWGVVIEGNYNLGSQNWHGDLLSAIFELSYLQGYIMANDDPSANYAAAYQYALERFQEKMSTAASFEVFGRFPSFPLT